MQLLLERVNLLLVLPADLVQLLVLLQFDQLPLVVLGLLLQDFLLRQTVLDGETLVQQSNVDQI